MTTERRAGDGGEVLMADQLVWAGAPDCRAHEIDPLPVYFCGKQCEFRASAIKALADAGLEWRLNSDEPNMMSIYASLEADLAVTPLLASTIPDGLVALAVGRPLPALPRFSINMYLPKTGGGDIAKELARHIRENFDIRQRQAA